MSDAKKTFQRCSALRKDGQPCTGKATNSGLCVAHDPRSAQWRVLGGKNSSKSERAVKLLPARLLPLVETLEKVFYELDRHERDVKEATAMASIAIAIGKLIQTGELEERTRELEKLAKEAAESRKWA